MKAKSKLIALWNTLVCTFVFFFVFFIFQATEVLAQVTLSGSGTEADPYLIQNATDWLTFASNISEGKGTEACYKLSNTYDDDTPIGVMVGTEENPFSGTLDGNHKMIIMSLSESKTFYVSPFRFIKNASIKNLTVAGNIAGDCYMSGLVGCCQQNSENSIENCVILTNNKLLTNQGFGGVGSDAYDKGVAGVVGRVDNAGLTIRNTVFYGNLHSNDPNNSSAAGIVGACKEGTRLVMDSCLFMGDTDIYGAFYPIAYRREDAKITCSENNCFYVGNPSKMSANHIAITGSKVYSQIPTEGIWKKYTIANRYEIYYQPDFSPVVGYLYSGEEITPRFSIRGADGKELEPGTDYEITSAPVMKDRGDYVITLEGRGAFSGSYSAVLHVHDGNTLTSDLKQLNGNVYFVRDNLTINDRIYVNGEVTLYLEEGKTLTAQNGINVGSNDTLIIEGKGSLTAYSANYAGIGGDTGQNSGSIIINGGNINISKKETSLSGGAAIGGGKYGSNGSITINDGEISCSTSRLAAAIGGGDGGDGGLININGGKVTATGGDCAAGIGGGNMGAGGTIKICGGEINAKSSFYGPAIGGGGSDSYFDSDPERGRPAPAGTIYLLGGKITAMKQNYNRESIIGPGLNPAYVYGDAGPVILGWNTSDDFIIADIIKASSVSIVPGKAFRYYINDMMMGDVTPENLQSKDTNWEIRAYDPYNIGVCEISGVLPYYSAYPQNYTVKDISGKTLVKGEDYTVSFDPASIDEPGRYSMTINGAGYYHGSKTVSFRIIRGAGTQADPFLIKNKDDWDQLAELFAANEISNNGTFNGPYHVKLSDDFDNSNTPITASLGTSENPFSGTFDGNGKTLYVAINDTENSGTAVFRCIRGATVKNLTVKGSVQGGIHAAGLVGICLKNSTNVIDNCIVDTAVKVVLDSDNRHMGGVVAHATTSNLTLRNTVFSGTMYNTGSYAGGMLGWSDGGTTLTIENCLFCGEYVGTHTSGFHPIAIKDANKGITKTINGAYYTVTPGLIDSSRIIEDGEPLITTTVNDIAYYYKAIPDQNFTGEELKPEPLLFDSTGLLKKDVDYTLSWENNTARAKSDSEHAPAIIVNEKKDASFTMKITFTIGKARAVQLADVVTYVGYTEEEPEVNISGIMPQDAGKLEYDPVTDSVDDNGHDTFTCGSERVGMYDGSVIITVNDAVPGCKVTLRIKISSEQYEDSFVNVCFNFIDEIKADTKAQTYVYDGNPHGLKLTVTNPHAGQETVTILYGINEGEYTQRTTPTITDAGKLRVYYLIKSTGNYMPLAYYTDVIIEKASIEPVISIESWDFGKSASLPTLTGNSGNAKVTFTYAKKGSDSFTENIPTEAGEYVVKASVEASKNYKAGTATAEFEIRKTAENNPGGQGGQEAGQKDQPAKTGDLIKDEASGAEYTVTSKEGETPAVTYQAAASESKEITVPDVVIIGGVTYQVTEIAKDALTKNKAVKKITIGKNVKKIGPYAFKGLKKLKLLIIRPSKLSNKSVDKKAFKGINKKVKIKVIKAKVKAYTKLFKKKGLPKQVKVKKI